MSSVRRALRARSAMALPSVWYGSPDWIFRGASSSPSSGSLLLASPRRVSSFRHRGDFYSLVLVFEVLKLYYAMRRGKKICGRFCFFFFFLRSSTRYFEFFVTRPADRFFLVLMFWFIKRFGTFENGLPCQKILLSLVQKKPQHPKMVDCWFTHRNSIHSTTTPIPQSPDKGARKY